MRNRMLITALAAAALGLLAGCGEAGPTGDSIAAHSHDSDPLLDANAAPEVRQKIAELRQWSARFHDVDEAIAAGYVNLGCIDETIAGVDPSVARGMGYHLIRGDLLGDDAADIDSPELLVYAPHARDAELPKAERLAKARFIGFEYFVPDPDRLLDAPEFFGEAFDYSETFSAWVRHIYLWGHNPEGMFENYNGAVRLCTELLSP